MNTLCDQLLYVSIILFAFCGIFWISGETIIAKNIFYFPLILITASQFGYLAGWGKN